MYVVLVYIMPICGLVALQFSLLHEHGFSLSCKKFFLATKYFFFLATPNCAAAVAALNHIIPDGIDSGPDVRQDINVFTASMLG